MEKVTISLSPFYIARLEEIAKAMTISRNDGEVWDVDDALYSVIASGLIAVEKEFEIDVRKTSLKK